MNAKTTQQVQAAQVVLPCAELDPTLEFFTERLGFRVAAIYPADSPTTVVVSGYGLRVQLEKNGGGEPGSIRLGVDLIFTIVSITYRHTIAGM